MNRFYKITALILSVLTGCSLCACGTAENSQSNTGDPGLWIETDVSPDPTAADILAVGVDDSNRLVCASVASTGDERQKIDILASNDGTAWDSEPLYSVDLSGNCLLASLYKDDSLLILTQAEGGNQIWYASQAATPVQLELANCEMAHINQLQFIDGNTFLLIGLDPENKFVGQIFQLSDGRMVTNVGTASSLPKWTGFAGTGSQLSFVSETGQLSTLAANGEVRTANAEDLTDLNAACCDAQGNYYYATQEGIYRIASGGTLKEEVVPSNGFAFSVQGQITTSLACFQERFYCVVRDTSSDSVHLYSYAFDPNAAPAEQTELTVWALDDSPTVRKVLSQYQQQHKEVAIRYTIAGSDDLATEDVLKALNTELLAGRGPDLIVFDGMDVTPYIENGVLADLSESVQEFSVLDSIKSAFSVEGKTYIAAARYAIPTIWGAAEDVDQITDLASFIQFVKSCPPRDDCNLSDNAYYTALPEKDKYAISFLTPEEILQFLMNTSASELITENTLNREQLQQLFQGIESIGTYYNMNSYRTEQEDDSILYSDGGDSITISGASREVINGRARIGWNLMDSPAFLGWIAKQSEDQAPALKSAPGLCERAYCPKVLLGVNANSQNQEAAKELLKAFFAPDIQNTIVGDGLPVLESSLDARIDVAVETYGTDREMLTDFLKGVQTPVIVDSVIENKLLPYAEALAKGQQNADAAAQAAEKDLRLYLAERQ